MCIVNLALIEDEHTPVSDPIVVVSFWLLASLERCKLAQECCAEPVVQSQALEHSNLLNVSRGECSSGLGCRGIVWWSKGHMQSSESIL